ncbi:MAG: DinB family protein [Chloroflexales bacterium]|nr:DinB family protein [Chloroflexales bacterium]
MNLEFFIVRLRANRDAIAGLLNELSAEQARWKPTPKDWSALEVINHLVDEERDDFRTRLRMTLFHPGEPWPPIDPEGWVVERAYAQRDLQHSIQQFLAERAESLSWLETCTEADWDATYQHPVGPITAGDLFAAWLAHDLLHLRQLVELHWGYLNQVATPYTTRYAGDW